MTYENGQDITGSAPESFEFPCDPKELPITVEAPVGELIFEIRKFERGRTAANVDGKLVDNPKSPRYGLPRIGNKAMATVSLQVVEPQQYAGIMTFEKFYLGTDDDPDAAKKTTWKSNRYCVLLNKLIQKAHVGGKTAAEVEVAAVGQQVGGSVRTKKSGDPKYSDQNVVQDYWEPGTKQVHVANPDADMDRVLPRPPVTPAVPRFRSDDE
jgi:hypothetical protein